MWTAPDQPDSCRRASGTADECSPCQGSASYQPCCLLLLKLGCICYANPLTRNRRGTAEGFTAFSEYKNRVSPDRLCMKLFSACGIKSLHIKKRYRGNSFAKWQAMRLPASPIGLIDPEGHTSADFLCFCCTQNSTKNNCLQEKIAFFLTKSLYAH